MNEAQEPAQISMKYVAFCDVLGFSDAVLTRFDETIAVYTEFAQSIRKWPFPQKVTVSVYSDSILVVSDDLPPLLDALKSLCWDSLRHDWLIRGGIAHGRYWEQKEKGNLFVVSDALVRAVRIEKSVKVPAIAFSEELALGIEAWVPRFSHGIFNAPVLHFNGLSFVNPFNPYWFATARMRLATLLARFPEHRNKYSWFLALAEAVERDDVLVPDAIIEQLLELGIIKPLDGQGI